MFDATHRTPRRWAHALIFSGLALLLFVSCQPTIPTPEPTPASTATPPGLPPMTATPALVAPTAQSSASRSTAVPILYEMHDWENTDFARKYPDWGPLGSWMWWTWAQVQPEPDRYNWAIIDHYLEVASTYTVTLRSGEVIAKPIALSIEVYPDWGQDGTPAWVYAQIPDALSLDGKAVGWVVDPDGADKPCPPIAAPRWGDPTWEKRFDEFVAAFGQRYDKDPRVNSVWIATGLYGETIEEKTQNNCRYLLGQGPNLAYWVWHVMDSYRAAFPTKPLFVINSAGWSIRRESAAKAAAYDPPMGIKLNVLAPDLNDAYGYKSQAGGGKLEIVERYSETLPIAFEHAFPPRPAETYWSLMCGLAHHATLMDFTAPDIFQVIHDLDPIFPLWEFVDNHLARKAETTPDVWLLLRETYYPAAKFSGWNSGEPGDWGFFLTRPEGIPENRTVAITQTISSQLPAPARKHIYGAYATRRTDQRSGNRYMSFALDHRYPFWGQKPIRAGGDTGYKVEIVLLNRGTDQLALEYLDAEGQWQSRAITKGPQLGPVDDWVTVEWVLEDAYLHGELPGSCDLRLNCMDDGDEVIHRVRVEGYRN